MLVSLPSFYYPNHLLFPNPVGLQVEGLGLRIPGGILQKFRISYGASVWKGISKALREVFYRYDALHEEK